MRLREQIILALFQLGPRNDDFSKIEPLLYQLKEQDVTDFNFISPYGDSMAHICSFYQLTNTFKEIVTFCKKYHLAFNYCAGDTKQNMTPLHMASYSGNLDLVQFLVEQGHPVNVQGSTGKEPIHFAACHKNPEQRNILISFLLNKGANLHAMDKKGISAEYILNHPGVITHQTVMRITPLHWLLYTASHTNLKLSKLIGKEFNPGLLKIIGNEKEFASYASLQIPAELLNTVKKDLGQFRKDLLEINTIITHDPQQLMIRTDGNRTALMFACSMGFTWAVSLFVAHDTQFRERFGISQLDLTDIQNMNALHFASFDFRNTNQSIVKILLNYGARNDSSTLGLSALEIAKDYDFFHILRQIEKKNLTDLSKDFAKLIIMKHSQTNKLPQVTSSFENNSSIKKRRSALF